jgi:hypothetical protein
MVLNTSVDLGVLECVTFMSHGLSGELPPMTHKIIGSTVFLGASVPKYIKVYDLKCVLFVMLSL